MTNPSRKSSLNLSTGLSRSTQLTFVGMGLAAVLVIFMVIPAIQARLAASEVRVAPDKAAAGTFKASDGQWANLTVKPVQQTLFRSWNETDGRIATNDDTTTPVYSQYSGRVVKVFVKAGDRVTAGDPLLEVEASEFVQGQNDLIAAAAQLNTAKAQLHLAQTAERRQHDLFDAKGGALKDWQQAQVDLANAEGSARTAEIALASVRNRLVILGKSDAEIKALESRAVLQAANAVAVVRAPIGGTVIQRQVGVGQYISAGAGNPVFAIGDLATVWLEAKVREADAPAMRLGQQLEVRVLAYPGQEFQARVTYVAPTIESDTRRLPVRAEIANASGQLKPEMFASFRIITDEGGPSLGIPDEAILYEGETARVWVAGDDHTIGLRDITVGRHGDNLTEVTSGLQAAEKVVTKGSLFIDHAAKGD